MKTKKPENSAHGYTEGADYIPKDCAGDRIPLITTVEPSESQEDTAWAFIEMYENLKNTEDLAVPELIKHFTITRK